SDKFDILLGVEDEIRHSKEKDTALAARTQGRGRGKLQNRGYRQNQERQHQSRSADSKTQYDSSSDNDGYGPICWTYKGNHVKYDCPYVDRVEKFAISLCKETERKVNHKHDNKEKPSERSNKPQKSSNNQNHRQYSSNQSRRRRKHYAFAAKEHKLDSEHNSIDSDNDSFEEIAAISKESIQKSKIPQSSWVSDTAASSHMTDDHSLFREPLIPLLKRRRIR
ncbi:hypothetical protein K3495_g16882, partial [Podosphaera aphanis]